MTPAVIDTELQRLLQRARLTLNLEKGLIVVAIWLLCFTLMPLVGMTLLPGLLLVAVLLSGWWGCYPYYKRRQKLHIDNLIAHLNRHFAVLEDSAHLMRMPPSSLSLLARLQQDKVSERFMLMLTGPSIAQTMPVFRYKLSSSLLGLALLSQLLQSYGVLVPELLRGVSSSGPSPIVTITPQAQLSAINITIQPPAYTQLAASQTSNGDLAVLEGSMITWQLTIEHGENQVVPHYYIALNDQAPLALIKQDNSSRYVASQIIRKTAIYRIIDDQGKPLAGIYSLSVSKDKKPKVRVIEPKANLLELAKNAAPTFSSQALVSDDFAISKVEIIASVAKGSGEAVKFRDQTFSFDSQQTLSQGQLYHKDWDLTALGMAPGDEIYFTVMAYDNKTPMPQQGRSSTVIVRWLEEAQQGIAAQGVMVNAITEYFRSQRQIIIDTEQLVADKNDLKQTQLEQASVSIGQSQRDLKQRYGQYLGDEFGEGPGDQLDNATVVPEHDDEEHDHEQSDAHQHQTQQKQSNNDRSGAQAIIAQFAHEHEDVHVGAVSSQNPKAMMKKAVSIMWQAELHLMLYEPQLSLPYQYEAYKYLKLAKQAERIYVKRLGFEPPPVSEDKRLTGELDQVKSYQLHSQAALPTDDDALFRQTFSLLNQLKQHEVINPQLQQKLRQSQIRLTDLAQTRPNLIKQAATIERLLLANGKELTDCDGCLVKLQQKLWQLISTPMSHPVSGQQGHFDVNPVVKKYVEQISRGEND